MGGCSDQSLENRIRERAYEIWIAHGCAHGHADQHWLAAEREVTTYGVGRNLGGLGSQRPDCVAGLLGLELRNVAAKYPFERSHKFAGIPSNSGHGDYSRLSCGVRATQLGPGF